MRRRDWLRGSASASVGSLAMTSGIASLVPAKGLQDSLIAEENRREGTQAWMLERTEIDPKTRYRSPAVEGYASQASLRAGEVIELKISTRVEDRVDVTIYRMGYYAGRGGREVKRISGVPTSPQTVPVAGTRRLVDCQWPTSVSWTVPEDAVSGVYLAKLHSQNSGIESYIVFIVRDERPA